MFITFHAAAATLIGRSVPNPIIAFILGLISHFILDIIPHGDEVLGKKFFGLIDRKKKDLPLILVYGALDSFVLTIYLIFLFKNFDFAKNNSVIWAIIGGILPDALVALYKVWPIKPLAVFAEFHGRNHRRLVEKFNYDLPLKYSIVMQIAVILTLWFFIFR